MTTDSQTSANRANAQKSTGPRSVEGKRRSSFNALKHGACATQVVLPYEKRADYDQFHQNLLDDYQPQSVLEELMLERLATAQWLSRRVVGCMQDAFDVAARENGSPTMVSYPIFMKMKNQNDRTADRCTEMLLKLKRDSVKKHREFLKTQDLSANGFVPSKNPESAPPAQPGLHVVADVTPNDVRTT